MILKASVFTINYCATPNCAHKHELQQHGYSSRSTNTYLTFHMILFVFTGDHDDTKIHLSTPWAMLLFSPALRSWQCQMFDCTPLHCATFQRSSNKALNAPADVPLFYDLSDMVPSTRRVTTFFSDPTYYRSKQLASLLAGHTHYFIETRTLSTQHMQALIAIDDVDNPAFQCRTSTPLSLATLSTFMRGSSTRLSF